MATPAARLDGTQRFFEALRLQFLIGAVGVERVVAWSKRLLDLEREADAKDPWLAHLGRCKRLSTDLDGRPRTAAPTPYDRAVAEYVTLEAGLWVAGQKGEAVPAERVARRAALARELFQRRSAALEGRDPPGPLDPDLVEAPYLASIRWLEAERDQDERQAGRALERHLERVLRIEGGARIRRSRGGLPRASQLSTAEVFRWEAEVYVHAGRGAAAGGERKLAAFQASWVEAASNAHDATLAEFRARQADVDDVHLASLRQLDADRTRGLELKACEAHLARTQRLARELRARDDCPLGLAPGALECFRLDAEARVARARAAAAAG